MVILITAGYATVPAIASPPAFPNSPSLAQIANRTSNALVVSLAASVSLRAVGDRSQQATVSSVAASQLSPAALLQTASPTQAPPFAPSTTPRSTVTDRDLACSASPVSSLSPSETTVMRIGVRFLDGAGSVTDANGNLRLGRTPVDYICRNLRVSVGEPFRDDQARQDLRHLYALGIFSYVDFVTEANPDGGVHLLYRLQEGATNSFSLAGGADEVSGYYGGVSYRQQLGIASQIEVGGQYGTRGHLQLSGSFFTPPLGDGTLGYRVYGFNRYTLSSVFDEQIPLANGDAVRINRLSAGASLLHWFGDWQGEIGIAFNAISTRDGSNRIFATDALGNPLSFSGTGLDDLLTVQAKVTIDQRDNPSNPVYGGILTLSSEQSIPLARGNMLGNRLLANYVYYWALSDPRPDRLQATLAFKVQAGTVVGDLPPYLAFVAGGPESVR
ncbi:MAG: BamA/TamA family outer membrane protein, partial [Cyanobacteria bacterium]|nr:BamA/TamA family outer membrane protein [Cyanobacteriota bacterium]